MSRFTKFAALMATASVAITTPVFAQSMQDDSRLAAAQQRFDREVDTYRAEVERYRSIRADRRESRGGNGQQGYYSDERVETGYDPARYYRDGSRYQERVLANDDRVYRGNDGRYYCKRSDGTTGLIVGAVGGGILGNVIDGGRSRSVGTLIGGALGALAGREVERRNAEVRCR